MSFSHHQNKKFPFIFSRQHSNESVGSNPGSYAAMVASTKNGLLYQQPPSRHRPSTLPPPSHLSNLPSKMPFLNHPGNFTVHYKHFLNQKWKILQFLVFLVIAFGTKKVYSAQCSLVESQKFWLGCLLRNKCQV